MANPEPEKARNARRGIFKRLIFSALAVLLFLVLFELVLQLAGLVFGRAREKGIAPGSRVMVCIGDSNTYGLYLKPEQAYPAQLEKLLRRNGKNYTVINLGAPGQNSTEILNDLPRIFRKYHPAALVVMVGVNNRWNVSGQDENLAQKFLYGLKLYKLVSMVYALGIQHDSNWVVRRRDTGEIIVHRGRGYPVTGNEELRGIQRRFIQDLIKIVESCRADGVAIVLMTYAGDREHNYEVPNGLTRQVAEKMGAPLADNYAYFESRLYAPDGTFNLELRNQVLFEDIHPKPPGYGWIAENLYRVLINSGIVE